jgi:hypothetical protein
MEEQKLFNYELSEEMNKYLSDVNDQMQNKEGVIYEKLTGQESQSIDEGYHFAIKEGYAIEREEFEKVTNDFIELKQKVMDEDGELNLEMLEMVAGGKIDESDTGKIGEVAFVVVIVAVVAYL